MNTQKRSWQTYKVNKEMKKSAFLIKGYLSTHPGDR